MDRRFLNTKIFLESELYFFCCRIHFLMRQKRSSGWWFGTFQSKRNRNFRSLSFSMTPSILPLSFPTPRLNNSIVAQFSRGRATHNSPWSLFSRALSFFFPLLPPPQSSPAGCRNETKVGAEIRRRRKNPLKSFVENPARVITPYDDEVHLITTRRVNGAKLRA